jgi:FAD-linked sulfhydryl oxidase
MSAPEQTDNESKGPIRMPPQIWGPIFWSTLHIASLAYSDNPTERQKANMKAFYTSMIDVLPCPICRNHYEQNLEEMPLDEALTSRNGIISWVFAMHNRVNVQLGKREITFPEFVESMRNLEKSKNSNPPSFTNTNDPVLKEKCNESSMSLTLVDGVLLGSAAAIFLGVGTYYFYTEVLRKSSGSSTNK